LSLATAILTGDVAELPSRRDEDWRWTDLRGLIRKMPVRSPTEVGPPQNPSFAPSVQAEEIVILNGDRRGIDKIVVPEGEYRVVRLRFISRAWGTAHEGGLAIEVGQRAKLLLLESHESEGGAYVSSIYTSVYVDLGAEVERVVLLEDDEDAVTVVQTDVTVREAAKGYSQTILLSGAKRQRFETRVLHEGYGAEVKLDGVYLLADRRHADLTTMVKHAEPDGTTQQLTKGVVRDQGRGIFQGRIVVREGADGTDARMGHHALILSERAEVDAKPELLIHADDVQCAHGNTVGALDEAAIFYARQRGIPDAVARAMLTEAFVGEVIDRIGHEGAREAARAWAVKRLGDS